MKTLAVLLLLYFIFKLVTNLYIAFNVFYIGDGFIKGNIFHKLYFTVSKTIIEFSSVLVLITYINN